jgi:nicotinamide-nucleotide amidase
VSEQVACEMAAGTLKRARAQVALAITGVAGPTGGTADKPVGLVCFAWAHGSKITSETRRFDGDRESVRRQSVLHALERVTELL